MSFSSAVGWWQEWQLRILVLSSLFIQYVLYQSVWLRRNPNILRLRVLVWIAYIGGDALAIYALATLFNRQKQTWDGESRALEVVWAPVLLIHLGGQPWISAYSLEDNELWKRHTITLVSQVTVALYVFCKWWSGEKTLLAAAILLFVLGIIKFAQKPWALRTASFNSMLTSSTVSMLPAAQREGHMYSLEQFVQDVLETKVQDVQDLAQINYMFVDQSAPYCFRIAQLQNFVKFEDKRAYDQLQGCLGNVFDHLYTKWRSFSTDLGIGLMLLLLPLLALASVVVFATSNKDGQNEKDISVTYILVCGTIVLEFLFPCFAFCVNIPYCASFLNKYIEGWHAMVSQYNLISFCVRKKKPTFLMKLATFKFLRHFINQHWYIEQVPVAFQITRLVRRHVEDGWKKYIHDAASYKRFSELRGQWALRRHQQLGWAVKMPYDESVLIWHVTTDLCFYHPNTSPQGRQGEATKRSREISNYMIYMLIIRPEMLMPGTRSDLFTFASDQIVENSKGPFDKEEILAQLNLNMPMLPIATNMVSNASKLGKALMELGAKEEILAQEIFNMPMLPIATDMVSNASKLTKALMELGDEERWNVIQGVWVEMLCYSASRCRGYLHAKSLGEGGEYLSTVWLLWSLMGMETYADRNQRSEAPQEEGGEEAAAASTSSTQGIADQFEDNHSPV